MASPATLTFDLVPARRPSTADVGGCNKQQTAGAKAPAELSPGALDLHQALALNDRVQPARQHRSPLVAGLAGIGQGDSRKAAQPHFTALACEAIAVEPLPARRAIVQDQAAPVLMFAGGGGLDGEGA